MVCAHYHFHYERYCVSDSVLCWGKGLCVEVLLKTCLSHLLSFPLTPLTPSSVRTWLGYLYVIWGVSLSLRRFCWAALGTLHVLCVWARAVEIG